MFGVSPLSPCIESSDCFFRPCIASTKWFLFCPRFCDFRGILRAQGLIYIYCDLTTDTLCGEFNGSMEKKTPRLALVGFVWMSGEKGAKLTTVCGVCEILMEARRILEEVV